MAFAATTIWEVAATGSDGNAGADTNAGGFNAGSASFATDLTTTSNTGNTTTPEVSSASYNFIARDVGHWLFIPAGTNSIPGWYKITSVSANKATVDASIGSAVLYGVGGPYAVNTVDGIATVGTPTGLTWSIDYSQCGTGLAFTDLVQATTTTCTSAAMPMGKNFVGNTFTIVSGTGTWTAQTLQISSVTGTTATVEKTLGGTGGTDGTGVMGGCLASPGFAGGKMASGNKAYLKVGTYLLTSASSNVSGGVITLPTSSSTNIRSGLVGYNLLRPDRPTGAYRPTIKASGISTVDMLSHGASNSQCLFLIIDGDSLTSIRGIASASSGTNHFISVKNCTRNGINNGTCVFCDVTGSTTASGGAFNSCAAYGCVAWSNSISGFSNGTPFQCVSVNNSGASSDGFVFSSGGAWHSCTAYGNGRDGFRITSSASRTLAINCIGYANTGTNFNVSASNGVNQTYNCAAGLGGVSSADFSSNFSPDTQEGSITLTADPFTAKASGDFSLNNDAGGGAACRAAGIIGAFPGISTTAYPDIGAVQSQSSGGGGAANTGLFAGVLGQTGIGVF